MLRSAAFRLACLASLVLFATLSAHTAPPETVPAEGLRDATPAVYALTGARIVVALESTEGGAALVIAVEGAGPTTAEWRQDTGLDVESCRELALINGAELEVGPNPGPTARITFPAARCLGPL